MTTPVLTNTQRHMLRVLSVGDRIDVDDERVMASLEGKGLAEHYRDRAGLPDERIAWRITEAGRMAAYEADVLAASPKRMARTISSPALDVARQALGFAVTAHIGLSRAEIRHLADEQDAVAARDEANGHADHAALARAQATFLHVMAERNVEAQRAA